MSTLKLERFENDASGSQNSSLLKPFSNVSILISVFGRLRVVKRRKLIEKYAFSNEDALHYILNWSFPNGAFQGQWNTTKQQNRTITTTVKNPNWPEANQLAIYKCSWEVATGTTRNKFSEWSERVLNPGSRDLKASALTTGPYCIHVDGAPKGVCSCSCKQDIIWYYGSFYSFYCCCLKSLIFGLSEKLWYYIPQN